MRVEPKPKLTIALNRCQWASAIVAAPFAFVTVLRLLFSIMEWWGRVIGLGDMGATTVAAIFVTLAAICGPAILIVVIAESIVVFKVKQ